MKRYRLLIIILFTIPAISAEEFTETFDPFDPSRFHSKIPNKNTEVRDGALGPGAQAEANTRRWYN